MGGFPCALRPIAPAAAARDNAIVRREPTMEPSSRNPRQIDVLIGGAGAARPALAIALRQSLGFSVAVADPALARTPTDARASAIVAAARRMFEALGAWQTLATQPILDMVVTDSRLEDAVRPTFLTFDGEVEPG